jgi:hypothetical protein
LETAPNPERTGSSLPESSSSQDKVGENGKSVDAWPPVGGDRIAPQLDVRLAWGGIYEADQESIRKIIFPAELAK